MNPVYSLLLTFAAPLLAGYLGRQALVAADRSPDPLVNVSKFLKQVTNLVLTPASALLSLWALNFGNVGLVALPVIGVAYHAAGTLLSLTVARRLGMADRQRGAFMMAGMVSNLGLIGGLLCFSFFGETGFALASFFRLMELPIYFLVGYPVASAMGNGRRMTAGSAVRQVLTDPSLLLPILGIIAGLALSLTGVPRPAALQAVNALLVPVTTIALAFATGVSLRLGAITEHFRACGAMLALKFAVLPALVWGMGHMAGLGAIDGGLPLRVALLLSFMPVGFTAGVSATLFNLDEELANALWLTTTLLVLPMVQVLRPIFG